MKSTSLMCLAATFAICLSASQLRAATVANWTFETSLPSTAGPISPEVGSGSATSVHAVPGNFTSPSGNGSAASYSNSSWQVGDYFQFQTSTLGQSGIVFSWDQTRSSSGPGFQNVTDPNFKLQYSTDGSIFTDALNYVVPVVTWSSSGVPNPLTQFSRDLSSVTALNNQANVYFRLTSILAAQASSTAGTSRVDNALVSTVPEPGTLALAGLGFFGLIGIARRRKTL